METKINTKITFEKRQRTTIRFQRPRSRTAAWCELCAAETAMLTLTDAAIVSDTTQMAIFRQVENGELHFTETGAGALLICEISLISSKTKSLKEVEI